MNPTEVITALEDLEKVMGTFSPTPLVETFRMTTRLLLTGLKKHRDASLIVDGEAHLKQAKRIWGGAL